MPYGLTNEQFGALSYEARRRIRNEHAARTREAQRVKERADREREISAEPNPYKRRLKQMRDRGPVNMSRRQFERRLAIYKQEAAKWDDEQKAKAEHEKLVSSNKYKNAVNYFDACLNTATRDANDGEQVILHRAKALIDAGCIADAWELMNPIGEAQNARAGAARLEAEAVALGAQNVADEAAKHAQTLTERQALAQQEQQNDG